MESEDWGRLASGSLSVLLAGVWSLLPDSGGGGRGVSDSSALVERSLSTVQQWYHLPVSSPVVVGDI